MYQFTSKRNGRGRCHCGDITIVLRDNIMDEYMAERGEKEKL
jgi:hypothetical protein